MLMLPPVTLRPESEPSAAKFGVPVVRIARDVLMKPPPFTLMPEPFAITTSARRPATSTRPLIWLAALLLT